jgi:putative MATE family efflux protein
MKPASLTEGSVSRKLLTFALPILLGNVLHSINISINSIWIGRYLGEAAMTASSVANAVLFLLIGSAFGITMAASVLVGQYIGANRLQDAKHVVGTSASFFLAISVAITILGFLASDWLMQVMRTPADALADATSYMRVLFIAVPFLFSYSYAMAVLRGAGDAKTPFKFLALSTALDIALNPILIFGWGPVPALHIAGSAWASVIASAVSLVALIVYLYRTHNSLCLRGGELKHLLPDRAIVGTLLRKGIPMGLQMVVISLSGVLMISLVNQFGTDTAAAYGAALQVWNYIQMPAFAVSMAVSAMVAQNVGAARWDRVSRIAKVGVLYNVLLGGVLVLAIELASGHVLGLFLPKGSPALSIAEHINLIVAWSFVFFGVPLTLFGVVRATGAVMPPLAILFVTLIAFRFPFAKLLMERWGADAIWWSFAIAAALMALLAMAYYRYGNWRSARMMPAGAAAPLETQNQ